MLSARAGSDERAAQVNAATSEETLPGKARAAHARAADVAVVGAIVVIQAVTLALTFTWTVPFAAPLAQAEIRRRVGGDARRRLEPPPPAAPSPPPGLPKLAGRAAVVAGVRGPRTPRAAAGGADRDGCPGRARVAARDQAATVSVVVPDESPRAYDDLAALLAEVPGVNVVRTGSLGKLTTITLRGFNPDQVRVYVDGVPVNIAAGGGSTSRRRRSVRRARRGLPRRLAAGVRRIRAGRHRRDHHAHPVRRAPAPAPAPDRSARCSAT